MTGQQALDLLLARLGNRSDPGLRATCLLEMILAQQTVLEMGPYIPWFCVSESVTTTIVPGERRVLLPSDFLREMDDSSLWLLDTDGRKESELEKEDYDDLMLHWGNEAEGESPSGYALVGDYIHLFPIPTVAKTLMMKHYRRHVAPSDTASENAWLKHAPDLMIAAAGRQVTRQHIKDEQRAVGFANEMNEAYDRLHRFEVARDEAGRTRSMG